MRGRRGIGGRAEQEVRAYLEHQGFRIVAQNVQVGRLEIDLIARRGTLLVICEVRSRCSDRWIHPAHTVTPDKAARIRQAAARWLHTQELGKVRVRFDVACLVTSRTPNDPKRLTYYPNALY